MIKGSIFLAWEIREKYRSKILGGAQSTVTPRLVVTYSPYQFRTQKGEHWGPEILGCSNATNFLYPSFCMELLCTHKA